MVIDALSVRCGNLTVPHDKVLLHITLLGLIRRAMVAFTPDANGDTSGHEGSYCRRFMSVVIDATPVRWVILTIVHSTLFNLLRWRRTMNTAFAAAYINWDTFQVSLERSWRWTMDTAFAAADINSNGNAFQVSLYIPFRGQEGSCQCRVRLVMIDVRGRRWREHCNTDRKLQKVAKHR